MELDEHSYYGKTGNNRYDCSLFFIVEGAKSLFINLFLGFAYYFVISNNFVTIFMVRNARNTNETAMKHFAAFLLF